MAPSAMRLGGVLGDEPDATKLVLFESYRLKMVWVAAAPVAAQVVDLQTIRNRADVVLI